MPVHVQLSTDETHLVYEMQEPLTIEELMDAYKIERQLRDATQRTLHSIVDMSKIRRIPRNWLTSKAGPGFTHPRSGRILIVGISTGIKIIVQTIIKIVRYDKVQFFDTREEAEAHMQTLIESAASEDAAEASS